MDRAVSLQTSLGQVLSRELLDAAIGADAHSALDLATRVDAVDSGLMEAPDANWPLPGEPEELIVQ